MLKNWKPDDVENWVCIFESGTEYEVDLAKDYLANLNIPSNKLSKRDSAINVNVGDLAHVYLYVPSDFEKKARKAIEEWEADTEDDTDEDES